MLLVLVTILGVLVAQEDAASLGAPTPIRLFHTRSSAINYTATVPVQEETDRKVSVEVPYKIFTDEENKATSPTTTITPTTITTTLPTTSTIQHRLQDSDKEYFRSEDNTVITTTETTQHSTVYDFQPSTAQHRSLKELLNLARIKYLGHSIRKQSPIKTVTQSILKHTPKLNNRRIPKLDTNKQLRDLLPPVLRSSRLRLADPSQAQTQEFISMKNVNSSFTTTVPAPRQTEEATQMLMTGDKHNAEANNHKPDLRIMLSKTGVDNVDEKQQLYTISQRNYWGSSTLGRSALDDRQQEETTDKKELSEVTNIAPLMSIDQADTLVKSLHEGRSLLHHIGPMLTNIQLTQENSKDDVVKSRDKENKKETVSSDWKDEDDRPESVKEYTDDDTEYANEDISDIYDGQYHEVNPGQYHEVNPGQYHEENPGQYHEENPGQYHEEFPGQYHEYNPGQYHEISSGQEVQLDIEFNPEDETKTYNVHKKTGEYIIGEVGKIDINNGQTLEGVRYTAVDSMVDQAQIAEILQRYFGTKTN